MTKWYIGKSSDHFALTDMILIKVYDRYEFKKNCAKIMVNEGETM